MGRFLHFFYSRACLTLDGLHANLIEPFHKQVAILRVDNGLYWGAQHFDTVFLQNTFLIQFHTAVQGRLSAKRQQDTIRAFLLNDTLHKLRSYRLEIHGICDILRSLHGGNIGINQH